MPFGRPTLDSLAPAAGAVATDKTPPAQPTHMARESTLDEFLGGSERRDDAGADASRTGDAPDGTDRRSDPGTEDGETAEAPAVGDADPAPITCEWTPDGAACEACGATVARRWRDGDARVCADCKEW